MQYLYFLRRPGLKIVSRFQLVFAMLMFVGSPAWIGLLLVGALGARARAVAGRHSSAPTRAPVARRRPGDVVCPQDRDRDRRPDPARSSAAPSAAACASSRACHRNGVLPAAVADHVALPHAVPGRPAVRPRDRLGRPEARRPHHLDRGVPPAMAANTCWAPGSVAGAWRLTYPAGIPYALLIAGGPFVFDSTRRDRLCTCASATALARIGIGRLPEETAPPVALAALELPALAAVRPL